MRKTTNNLKTMMSMQISINEQSEIFNALKEINLFSTISRKTQLHIRSILTAALSKGYRGKTVDFAQYSHCHRTSLAYFLSKGDWDSDHVESVIHETVVERIYHEAEITGKPVYCIIDDTISSKTKPSSQAKNPMEGAAFHMSHLKRKQDYGHQAIAVMLSCNHITLNYAIQMYQPSVSKIDMVCQIAQQLPEPPTIGYLLCDSWYTCNKVMDSFVQKGFYTIGALKTNRILYPCGVREKLSSFASRLDISDAGLYLVTVQSRQYYTYRYEGHLNGLEDAVVILSFPKDAFGNLKVLRAFLSTDTSLSTEEILNTYVERWPIEVFFRDTKGKLALNGYQIRSLNGIRRYWLLMSLAHLLCCIGSGDTMPFCNGYSRWNAILHNEQVRFIYQCGSDRADINQLLIPVA